MKHRQSGVPRDSAPRPRATVVRSFGALLWLICAALAVPVSSTEINLLFTWNIQGEVMTADSSAASSRWLDRWAALSKCSTDSSTLLIDLGNTFYPGYLSRFSYGSILNELLNQVHFSAKCVTPKDFYQGRAQLGKLRERAAYDFLSTNILDKSSKKNLFAPVTERTVEGIRLRFLSIASPAEAAQARNLRRDSVEIAAPAECLKRALRAPPQPGPVVTICLCDKLTLEQFPALLDLDGIDIFVCGLPDFDPAARRGVSDAKLANGKRIVSVPPFSKGAGRLVISSREAAGVVDRVLSFATFDLSSSPIDSAAEPRLRGLTEKWTDLYTKETSSFVAQMDTPLKKNQPAVIGNLLRERFRCDLACLESSLVSDAVLPARITMKDLDRLLTASPDLLLCKFPGSAITRLRRVQGVTWIGVESRGGIVSKDVYSVVLTESAFARLKAEAGGGTAFPAPHYTFTSVTEAIEHQLSERKRRTYDFGFLDRRWQRCGETETEISLRRISVGNPNHIETLSGVTYEPFSDWDLNVHLPLRFYNCNNRFDFLSNLEYSAASGVIERNFLEFKLDYSYSASPVIGPYASADYQTFLLREPKADMPIQMRTTLGVVATPDDWTLKLGFGAEKLTATTAGNPFAPLQGIFPGNEGFWNPAFEIDAEGSYSVADLLRTLDVQIPSDQDIHLDLLWDNTISLPRQDARLETRLNVDLSADIIPGINVKTGYDIFYARFFHAKNNFYNLEPSLSIVGSFPFKW